MILASFSLLSCFAVVPEATSEWKPEIAPQATVTKSIGKRQPKLLSRKAVYDSNSIDGLEKKIPINAPIISV